MKSMGMLRRSRAYFGLAVALLAGLLLVSCEQERDTFGGDFIPEEEELHLQFAGSSGLETYTDELALSPVLQFNTAPLGAIHDRVFGASSSTVLTEVFPSSWAARGLDEDTELEEAYFTLSSPRAYGDGEVKVRVIALANAMVSEGMPELKDFAGGELIAEGAVDPGKTEIRLEVDRPWAKAMLLAGRDSLKSFESWKNYFHGIRIEVERVGGAGEGRMFSLNLGELSNGLHFSWMHEGKKQAFQLRPYMDAFCRRGYFPQRDFAGAELEGVLTSTREAQNASGRFYLSSASHVRGVVDFARFVKTWKAKMPVAISRAELRIPYSPENRLFGEDLVTVIAPFRKVGDKYFSIPDLEKKNNLYQGTYNKKRGYFSLNITLFVQNLLQYEGEDSRLFLTPGNTPQGYNRAVLANCMANTGEKMELVLTYTKL